MSNSKEELREISRILSGRKKQNPFLTFLFFALIGGVATYIVLGWLQLLLLLLWGISQTKLQIFVVMAFLIIINSLKITFTWNLK